MNGSPASTIDGQICFQPQRCEVNSLGRQLRHEESCDNRVPSQNEVENEGASEGFQESSMA